MNRRGFLLALTTGAVALGLVVGTVIADELLGMITQVDAQGQMLVVVPKDSEKEIKVKVTEKTELVTRKGTSKLELKKVERYLEKMLDRGAKGIEAKITHDNGVASKVQYTAKKKAAL
jgi:hypothetical protein